MVGVVIQQDEERGAEAVDAGVAIIAVIHRDRACTAVNELGGAAMTCTVRVLMHAERRVEPAPRVSSAAAPTRGGADEGLTLLIRCSNEFTNGHLNLPEMAQMHC